MQLHTDLKYPRVVLLLTIKLETDTDMHIPYVLRKLDTWEILLCIRCFLDSDDVVIYH